MPEFSAPKSQSSAQTLDARELQAMLYRQIGISAVAAALEVQIDCPAEPKPVVQRDIPPLLRKEALAA